MLRSSPPSLTFEVGSDACPLGWQDNPAGDREVQKALRYILWLRYKVRDEDIFAKAHGYIREYY